jgi:hypothetical protein
MFSGDVLALKMYRPSVLVYLGGSILELAKGCGITEDQSLGDVCCEI